MRGGGGKEGGEEGGKGKGGEGRERKGRNSMIAFTKSHLKKVVAENFIKNLFEILPKTLNSLLKVFKRTFKGPLRI